MHLSPDYITGLRLAIRARFFTVTIWFLVALATVVLMSAQFSARQPATVALDVGLSAIRLALPIFIVLLVQELFSREFDKRYILTTLTYPRARWRFFVGRFLAIFSLVLCLLTIMATLLAILAWLIGGTYEQGTPVALGSHYVVTTLFIALDLFVITAMGSLLSIAASTPSFTLIGVFGFLLISRSYSTIISMLGQGHELVSNPELYKSSLKILHYLLPDLASLDVRMITLYGQFELLPTNLANTAIGAAVYGFVLIFVAMWLLQRKRFN